MSGIVLVAVHDSATAFAAAERGIALAKALGARVHAVEVVEPPAAPASRTAPGVPPGTARADADTAPLVRDGVLRHLERVAAAAGVPFTSEARRGLVAPSLLDAAAEVGADYIVMARVDRPGHTIPGIGSRTLRVLEFADVPVIVVPAIPSVSNR
ncbi:universal stress protein [Gryllotalpicola sp.]|uniref:universal stress protein n=1 Tax=Gryllotalpicola sp. TaxID=1932787 RepID=UPI002622F57B|nr:universal stress protein [Gryllotalpicola sp.]